VALFIYISWTIPSICSHEAWRDETNPWVVSRDNNLLELIGFSHYETHPIGWYLLQYPLAHLNLPFESVIILHTLIVFLIAFILCFKLNALLGLLILFSTELKWETAVLVREYSPAVLVTLILVLIFNKRFDKHWISYSILAFFIANISTVMFPFAIALLLYEIIMIYINQDFNYKRVCPIILLMLFVLFSFLCLKTTVFTKFAQFIYAPQNLPAANYFIKFNPPSIKDLINTFCRIAQHFPVDSLIFFNTPYFNFIKQITAIIFIFLPVFLANKQQKFITIIPIITVLLTIIIFQQINIYYYTRYAYVLTFNILAIYFIILKNNKLSFYKLISLCALILIMSSGITSKTLKFYDAQNFYSSGKHIAQWLISHNYDNNKTLIMCDNAIYAPTISAYMKHNRKFLCPQGFRSYTTWQDTNPETQDQDYKQIASRYVHKTKLLIMHKSNNQCEQYKNQLIYSGPSAAFNEEYNIYSFAQ